MPFAKYSSNIFISCFIWLMVGFFLMTAYFVYLVRCFKRALLLGQKTEEQWNVVTWFAIEFTVLRTRPCHVSNVVWRRVCYRRHFKNNEQLLFLWCSFLKNIVFKENTCLEYVKRKMWIFVDSSRIEFEALFLYILPIGLNFIFSGEYSCMAAMLKLSSLRNQQIATRFL